MAEELQDSGQRITFWSGGGKEAMAVKLTKRAIFQFETRRLGVLNTRDLVWDVERCFARRPKETSSAEEAIRFLASLTLYRQCVDSTEDTFTDSNKITSEEVGSLTKAELDKFSEAFVENSRSLFQTVLRTADENGESGQNPVVMRFHRTDFQKNEGEAPTEHLYRTLLDREERRNKELQKVMRDFYSTFPASIIARMGQAFESSSLLASLQIEECAKKMAQIQSPISDAIRNTQEHFRRINDVSLGSFSAVAEEHARVVNEIQNIKFELLNENYFKTIQSQFQDISKGVFNTIESFKKSMSDVVESTFLRNMKETFAKFQELPDKRPIFASVGQIAIESSVLKMLQDIANVVKSNQISSLDFSQFVSETIEIGDEYLSVEEISCSLKQVIEDTQIYPCDALDITVDKIAQSIISKVKEPFPQKVLMAFLVNLIVTIIFYCAEPLFNVMKPSTPELSPTKRSSQFEQQILYGIVTGDKLNIREQDNKKAIIVGRLSRGDVVKITIKHPNWYLIEWRTDSCLLKGWASAKHIKMFKLK